MAVVTHSQLKTSLARRLRDPDAKTFVAADLTDMLNAGIAEVSRLCPQHFVQDITLEAGTVKYPLTGGAGNLVANWSFEDGDSLFDGYTEVTQDDTDPMGGWAPSATTDIWLAKNTNAVAGRRVLVLRPRAAQAATYVYQFVPINASTTYILEGAHWKGATGGIAARISFQTYTNLTTFVQTVASWDTTSNAPVKRKASFTSAADSSELYVRVVLQLFGTQPASPLQGAYFDSIRIVEQSEENLVSLQSVPDIEVARVEQWYYDDDEAKFLRLIPSASSQPQMSSAAGWSNWGGDLYLPDRIVGAADTSSQFVRVFGYSPYDTLVDDAQSSDLTDELQVAVLQYAEVEALERLVMERDLYTQWQTRAGNSDVSPAGLMNSLNIAREQWRQRSRHLTRLRATV